MKQLILRLVIPLTVISLAVFTKWWYALPIDAPDTIFSGFPLPFVSKGWHTSLSLQIFIAELLIDLLVYFSFWLILAYIYNRYFKVIIIHRTLTILLASLAGLTLTLATIAISNKDNLVYFKRPRDMEIMETGYKFIWQKDPQPDFYKYHPERQNK